MKVIAVFVGIVIALAACETADWGAYIFGFTAPTGWPRLLALAAFSAAASVATYLIWRRPA